MYSAKVRRQKKGREQSYGEVIEEEDVLVGGVGEARSRCRSAVLHRTEELQ